MVSTFVQSAARVSGTIKRSVIHRELGKGVWVHLVSSSNEISKVATSGIICGSMGSWRTMPNPQTTKGGK